MTNKKLPAFLMQCAAIVAVVLFASLARAAILPPAARVEIESLLSRLEASECQFYRNGSWHASAEAQAHLRRKLDYLVGKGAIASTEQFIERAATKSSVSGQAYLVRCGATTPVQSSLWFHAQLRALRAASAVPAPP
jgi:Family of unknown function (DUF5329)